MSTNFLQTQCWYNFWIKANGISHKIHLAKTEIKTSFGLEEYSVAVYQYPWKFNQVWLYVPRLGSGFGKKSKKEATALFQKLVEEIISTGKNVGATLLKIDFDPEFYSSLLNGDSINHSGEHSHSKYLAHLISEEIVPSLRQINFLSTIILNISDIKASKYELPVRNTTSIVDKFLDESEILNDSKSKISFSPSLSDLKHFFQNNTEFWSKTNQNIRRYTKKSLEMGWTVEINNPSFDDWYAVHHATTKRQDFATHPKSYLKELFHQDFAHSIILKDQHNIPQSCWLGGVFNDTIVYLHGGNNPSSFNNYGQYLIHLTAIYIGKAYNCNSYDLGGWEEGKGFSKFKEGYKGEIVTYPGAFDVILKEPDYFLTRLSQWFKKRG